MPNLFENQICEYDYLGVYYKLQWVMVIHEEELPSKATLHFRTRRQGLLEEAIACFGRKQEIKSSSK